MHKTACRTIYECLHTIFVRLCHETTEVISQQQFFSGVVNFSGFFNKSNVCLRFERINVKGFLTFHWIERRTNFLKGIGIRFAT